MKETVSKSLKRLITTTTTSALMALLVFTPLLPIISFPQQADAASPFGAVWVNDGQVTIFQEDRPAYKGIPTYYEDHQNPEGELMKQIHSITSYIWDGTTIYIKGAKNEVVDFNLMLEGNDTADIAGVTVNFDKLTGPGGYEIKSKPVTGDGVFDYVDREIELFYTWYAQWKGVSDYPGSPGYPTHDGCVNNNEWNPIGRNKHLPQFRYDYSTCTRPNLLKHGPDALIPIELVYEKNGGSFTVLQGKHQAIWADIYIPKDAPAGTYTGTVQVKVNGQINESIPVSLTVRNFALPDDSQVKTAAIFEIDSISSRFYRWQKSSIGPDVTTAVMNMYKLAHRHRLTLLEEGVPDRNKFTNSDTVDCSPQSTVNVEGYSYDIYAYSANNKTACLDPSNVGVLQEWEHLMDTYISPVYTGSLFTREHGYDGPGVNTGFGFKFLYIYFITQLLLSDELSHDGVGWPYGDNQAVLLADGQRDPLSIYPKTKQFMLDWAPVWQKWFAQHAPHTDTAVYMKDENVFIVPFANELAKLFDQMNMPIGIKNPRVFSSFNFFPTMYKSPNPTRSNKIYKFGYKSLLGQYQVLRTLYDGREALYVRMSQNFPYLDMLYNSVYPCGLTNCAQDAKQALREQSSAIDNSPYTDTGKHEIISMNGYGVTKPGLQFEDAFLRPRTWVMQKFLPHSWDMTFKGTFWDGSGPYNDGSLLNFWENLHTHGIVNSNSTNPEKGEAGGEYFNLDGLLFYPGIDAHVPQHSWGVRGVLASIRLKRWRRSMQDGEYIIMARNINETQAMSIVRDVIPRAMWDTQCHDNGQLSDSFGDSSSCDDNQLGYAINPELYNTALEQLSQIIVDNGGPIDTIKPQITPRSFIATTTTNTSPSYTFYTTEAGTVSYTGSCGNGNITQAQEGLNTVTYSNLSNGAYTDCIIRVTDQSSNQSPELLVKEFIVNVDGISDIRADVDNSGTLTVSDAQKILRKSVGLTVTDWYQGVHTGDVNCTGAVSVADALLVLRKSVNLPTPSWCDIQF